MTTHRYGGDGEEVVIGAGVVYPLLLVRVRALLVGAEDDPVQDVEELGLGRAQCLEVHVLPENTRRTLDSLLKLLDLGQCAPCP